MNHSSSVMLDPYEESMKIQSQFDVRQMKTTLALTIAEALFMFTKDDKIVFHCLF